MKMTTRQRLDLLARADPRLFPRTGLLRLLRAQLGRVDALERGSVRAPRLIYHICAGNLAISAITSLAHGLLLGARNVLKLPGDRDDATTRREILTFIHSLPASLQALVETHRKVDPATLRRADAIIAFGSDATMASLRTQIRWDQKFVPHGHALSLLYLAQPGHFTPRLARACATDILTYDQLGCLSPQAIYVPPGTDISALAQALARALEAHWQGLAKKPARPLGTASRIAEARDLAHALGHRVWMPRHPGWTLIHDPNPDFEPSPLHGTIAIREAGPRRLAGALAPVAGKISTVAVAGKLSPRLRDLFLTLGVTRFCAPGRMQFPPLTWHHDGRAPLAELVTWVDVEHP